MSDSTDKPQDVKPKNPPGQDKAWQLYPDGLPPEGFFAATRGTEARAFAKKYPLAHHLAWFIADRTQWTSAYNEHNLQIGEAFLGDYWEYGLTRGEYRGAIKVLKETGFATFKPARSGTIRGTVAKLCDTRLFAVSIEPTNHPTNHQSNHQLTISQPSPNHHLTTSYKDRRVEGIERENESTTSLTSFSEVPKDKGQEIQAFHALYQQLTGYSEIALDMARERQWFEWLQYGITHQHLFTHDDFKLVVKLIREGIANAKSNQGAYKRNQGALKFDNLIGDPGRFEQDLAEARTHFGKRIRPAIDPNRAAIKATAQDPREKPMNTRTEEEKQADSNLLAELRKKEGI